MDNANSVTLGTDQAIALIIKHLKGGSGFGLTDYGYDLQPGQMAYRWARNINSHQEGEIVEKHGHVFYDAAWELCRRGIFRPGVKTFGKQAVDDGGYSLTEQGKEWLRSGVEKFELLDPSSRSKVLAGFKDRFGDGFHQRSQEAIKCQQAEAWLACCAMAGAASESVLLSLAVTKTKDEAKVLADYGARDGRRAITNLLVGKLPKHIAETLKTFLGLLAYWRDEASHGQLSDINVANADEAMRQLIHMAQWADRNWAELTAQPPI